MKAKIDVTIFKNGDMDILQASIYEELWKDYCTFKQRAVMQQEKETKKGIFLSRRYYRAALLSLFTFLKALSTTGSRPSSRTDRNFPAQRISRR